MSFIIFLTFPQHFPSHLIMENNDEIRIKELIYANYASTVKKQLIADIDSLFDGLRLGFCLENFILHQFLFFLPLILPGGRKWAQCMVINSVLHHFRPSGESNSPRKLHFLRCWEDL